MVTEFIRFLFKMKSRVMIILLTSFFLLISCKSVFQGVEVSVKRNKTLVYLDAFKSDNWIIINTLINGKKAKGLIDTGSNLTLIDSVFSAKIPSNSSVDFIDIKNRKLKKNLVVIKKIKLGEFIDFENINAVKTNLRKYNIDIVIGNNMLKKLVWSIDFNKGIVRVGKSIEDFKLDKKNYIRNEFKLKENLITTYLKYKSYRKEIILDTGSKSQIILPSKDIKLFKNQTFTKTTNKYFKLKTKLKNITLLNDINFNDVLVVFGKESPRIFGVDLLQNNKIIIDYSNSNLYLSKIKNNE